MAVPPGPESTPATGVPTCYRHPGRETYVSCVRCGRPACPDCLRSAAVSARQPRAVFGGRAVSGAIVTWSLVAINVACYLAELISQTVVNDGILVGRIGPTIGVADGQWYRLITSAFLHEPGLSGFGPAHIIFNMWALVVVGPSLERLLGRVRFLTVYLVSALAGSVLYYLLAPPTAQALGASGAIFGLFGAWFVVARRLRLDSRAIVFLIVINLVISFTLSGIAWQAHVGGLVAGGLLTAAYVYAPRSGREPIQLAATVAVVAALVIGVLIRDHQLASTAFT